MKKTRLLAFLITVCLATTCFLSGTVAKYSTSDAAADQGTVAKWGIQLNITGSLFGEKYTDGSTNGAGIPTVSNDAISVKVEDSGNVVAPGTNSEKPINVSLKGTAETDLTVTFTVDNTDGKMQDIYLAEGTYYIMAEENVTVETFDALKANLYTESTGTYTKLENDATYNSATKYYMVKTTVVVATGGYRPVVYTLKNNVTTTSVEYKTVAELMNALQNGVTGANPTKNLDVNANDFATGINYDITWAWAFHVDANTDNCDTILGLLIAGQTNVVKAGAVNTYVQLVKDTDYNTTTAFNFEIKVEQAD